MESQIISENMVLFYFVGIGVVITFVYDCIRIIRNVYKHNWVMISIEDILFWCFCATVVFILLQRENNGILRWFSILGAILGMICYHKLVGKYFVKYGSKLLQTIHSIVYKPIHKSEVRIRNRGKQVLRLLRYKIRNFTKILKVTLSKK